MAENRTKDHKSVVLDTCFLIALYNKDSPFFKSAKTYYEYFLKNNIEMHIPTIVISEFNQLFTIAPIIQSGNYRQLVFSYEDAIAVGDVAFHLGITNRNSADSKDSSQNKAEIKDDIKILGQIKNRSIDYLVSSDDQITKRCLSLKKAGIVSCNPISIRKPFDSSTFNKAGQANLLDSLP